MTTNSEGRKRLEEQRRKSLSGRCGLCDQQLVCDNHDPDFTYHHWNGSASCTFGLGSALDTLRHCNRRWGSVEDPCRCRLKVRHEGTCLCHPAHDHPDFPATITITVSRDLAAELVRAIEKGGV